LADTQNAQFTVKPKKIYLVHFINMGSFVGSFTKIDGHKMTIVEIDGVYTAPQDVDELYLTVAQRYSVLITTKSDTSKNFLISNTLDTSMFDHIPDWAKPDVYGFLVYDSKKPLPAVKPLRDFSVFDDFQLIPRDRQKALTNVDQQIILTMDFERAPDNDNGINR
jgi:iron transport multicopper oxidase